MAEIKKPGVPDSTRRLRGVTVDSAEIVTQSRSLRSGVKHSFLRGTATTPETRRHAQDPQNIPLEFEATYATNRGRTGSWSVPNPLSWNRTRAWKVGGATVGAFTLGAFGAHYGASVTTAMGLGPESGAAWGRSVGATVGAVAGGFLGYVFAPGRPRDAGHKRPRQMGGSGDDASNIFGQTPEINRGNRLDGKPTFSMHRAHENKMTKEMREDGGGWLTNKTRSRPRMTVEEMRKNEALSNERLARATARFPK